MAEAAPKGFGLALGVAVIAAFLAVGAIAFAYVGASSQVTNLQGQVSTLQSQIPALIAKSGIASINATPSTVAFKVDWCNTGNSGQDRFCPPTLIVHQGDIVQLIFVTNDTDAHTFTLVRGGYNFQMNNTYGQAGTNASIGNGMHNFITNGYFQSSCTSGSYSQASASVSSSMCVSGSNLLPSGAKYIIPVNAQPAVSPAAPETITVDNSFHVEIQNATFHSTYSVASFRATLPGIFEYFCYYHVSNGMFGYLIVLPNTYCNAHSAACTSTSNSNS